MRTDTAGSSRKTDDRHRRQAGEAGPRASEEGGGYARKQAVASERQKESRQQDKARQEYSAAVEDIFRIYDIQMLRREPIDGLDTILATLTPKPGARPQTDDGKIMRHFKARAGSASRTTSWCGWRSRPSITCRSASACWRACTRDGRDLPASQGQRRDVASGRGHVDGQRARPAPAPPSAARRLRVLQLPPLQRGYDHDDRRAPLTHLVMRLDPP